MHVRPAREADQRARNAGDYDGRMGWVRIPLLVLATLHALFSAFTALVGAFADGGDVWQRLLLVVVHPVGAAGVLTLVLLPRLSTARVLAIVALLTVNVTGDLLVARLIATGAIRGDWELALAFAVVPALGIAYGLARLGTSRATTD